MLLFHLQFSIIASLPSVIREEKVSLQLTEMKQIEQVTLGTWLKSFPWKARAGLGIVLGSEQG